MEAAKESWRDDMREKQPGSALGPVASLYERTQSGIVPLDDENLPEIDQAITRREIFIEDRTTDSVTHTALVSPITLRGEVIGALGFHEDDSRQWTADEIALIEDVAMQVSLAVENVHLFEQTQTALEETDALYRASRAIAAADSGQSDLTAGRPMLFRNLRLARRKTFRRLGHRFLLVSGGRAAMASRHPAFLEPGLDGRASRARPAPGLERRHC